MIISPRQVRDQHGENSKRDAFSYSYPHAKVARAFDVFRKLGMRHMCVVDNAGMLAGIITRKDLMTFRLSDNIRMHKAEALLRGWANRWRAQQALKETFGGGMHTFKAPAPAGSGDGAEGTDAAGPSAAGVGLLPGTPAKP